MLAEERFFVVENHGSVTASLFYTFPSKEKLRIWVP